MHEQTKTTDRFGTFLMLVGIVLVAIVVIVPTRGQTSPPGGMLDGVTHLVNGGQPLGTSSSR